MRYLRETIKVKSNDKHMEVIERNPVTPRIDKSHKAESIIELKEGHRQNGDINSNSIPNIKIEAGTIENDKKINELKIEENNSQNISDQSQVENIKSINDDIKKKE